MYMCVKQAPFDLWCCSLFICAQHCCTDTPKTGELTDSKNRKWKVCWPLPHTSPFHSFATSAGLLSQPQKYPDAMQCLKPWRINYTLTSTHTYAFTQALPVTLTHTLLVPPCLRGLMQVCLTLWGRGKDCYIMFQYIYIQRTAPVLITQQAMSF